MHGYATYIRTDSIVIACTKTNVSSLVTSFWWWKDLTGFTTTTMTIKGLDSFQSSQFSTCEYRVVLPQWEWMVLCWRTLFWAPELNTSQCLLAQQLQQYPPKLRLASFTYHKHGRTLHSVLMKYYIIVESCMVSENSLSYNLFMQWPSLNWWSSTTGFL